MVLARNTYRFSLLVVGTAIAMGVDDLGGHSADVALLGLGLGGAALLLGTLAHYARGSPPAPDAGDGGGGDDGPRAAEGDDDGDGGSEREHRGVEPAAVGWY